MPQKRFRVFATADIGEAAFNRLRERGYEVEVYPKPEPPPKSLIIEKVRSGIDGLITTLRDKIDAEVFEAGNGTLKVVAQYAVGFDNINRADANRCKIPFTNTADVLTEATAEFAFFALADLARKLWSAEHLVRENKWGYWHPYLPFLGDEVTGKTIGILGTGRIGQAVIKKCIGFDMNILCYEAMGPNEKLVADVQRQMELRYGSGMQRERTSIKYVSIEEALSQSDFVSIHVPLLREGESDTPTYHLINERTLRTMKPTAYLVNTSRGPVVDETALAKALKEKMDCRSGARCVRNRAAAAGLAASRSGDRGPMPAVSALRQRRANHQAVPRSFSRHGRPLRARPDRRAGAKLRRRYNEDAVRGEQGSVSIASM